MLQVGKIPQDILHRCVFNNTGAKRKEVLVASKIGEDCSALKLDDDEVFVISSDPITGADKDIGYIGVHINTNDIASSGADPIGIMVTIMLPKESNEEQLENIMSQLSKACKEIDVQILGGHTEVTDAVNRPIISVTSIGKVNKNRLITTGGAKAGQDVILTKWAGLEGTAIIATDKEELLINNMKPEAIKKAKQLKYSLSVIPESRIARNYEVSCMHDVTEGGVFGAAWEIAECSNVGIEINVDDVPVLEETKQLCEVFNIDPYKLISSGCMILTADDGKEIVKELLRNNVSASIIGKIRNDKKKLVNVAGTQQKLEEPVADELYKVI